MSACVQASSVGEINGRLKVGLTSLTNDDAAEGLRGGTNGFVA